MTAGLVLVVVALVLASGGIGYTLGLRRRPRARHGLVQPRPPGQVARWAERRRRGGS